MQSFPPDLNVQSRAGLQSDQRCRARGGRSLGSRLVVTERLTGRSVSLWIEHVASFCMQKMSASVCECSCSPEQTHELNFLHPCRNSDHNNRQHAPHHIATTTPRKTLLGKSKNNFLHPHSCSELGLSFRSAVTASFAEPARCNHAGFEARNYAVTSFREIRSIFGISTSEYARAFPNDVSEHEPHWHQKLSL